MDGAAFWRCADRLTGAAGLLAAVFVSACTAPVTYDEQGRRVEHHFGYVRVVLPPKAAEGEDFRVEGIRTAGITVGDGVGVGYIERNRTWIPLDCRIVIFVKDQQQLDDALDNLENVAKGELCVAVSPE